ncbi:MAG: 2-amino-4-hydroxy-6-hydroxymethyldihydropteridine diphosphokinase [Sedimentisphaerales bacterium]|jgi:2-amino-4-hydroxy-6-hydroxymethyldihydropteridine diphosphokinase|nr:2-amino-4-hydroxy-6-hydroxymethyldihydropteridine diphosphokinase [Sedimentisphaerales bacterium]
MPQTIAYVGLGSNQGDRHQAIRDAVEAINCLDGTKVMAVSTIIQTRPLHPAGGGPYLNAVVRIQTGLAPDRLLEGLMQIEGRLGRIRKDRWGPRPIDLDLLLFGDQVIESETLRVPHPQMHLRSFVLQGLVELEPGLVHPVLGRTVRVLAERLNGKDYFVDPQAPKLICMAGLIGAGKTSLARRLADLLGGTLLLEPYDTNPFLPQVYAGRHEFALYCQLYFLIHRIEQLARDKLASRQVHVADYVFDQELVYARTLLDRDQLGLYQPIYEAASNMPSRPLLVIWLQASVATCLDRIDKRGRLYERALDAGLLRSLSDAYEWLFSNWDVCPVIRIDTEQFDVCKDRDVMALAKEVDWYIRPPGW